MKYYDKKKNQLVLFQRNKVDKDYWDKLWLNYAEEFKKFKQNLNPKSLIVKTTKNYLKPSDGPILEGGCGLGNQVYKLKMMEYNVIGVDNARNTINLVKSESPELNIQYGDIKELAFDDNYFAGYWSLGVIEHFFQGYLGIIPEIYRVIRPEGYLFITFPYMSPMRKLKVKLNLYKPYSSEIQEKEKHSENFYQFILNEKDVIENFKSRGFILINAESLDGLLGFINEVFIFKCILKKSLRKLYQSTRPKFLIYFKSILNKILSKYSAHMKLLIFQKL
jgi:SAM-dependent methyltransferase